ncbi:hypothetical protein A9Q99_13260 [Gammaproteobacteria bacterium 45_16_T64]|nr:hypothetical protein A9Q99_13260 [Gammaproteobacteria bacterium 45_16_T64]
MRTILGLGIAALMIGAAWWLWPEEDAALAMNIEQVETPVSSTENGKMAKEKNIASNWISPNLTYDNYESEYGDLPPSLIGTTIPFRLEVNDRGELIVSSHLRRFFDYFLTTVGEEPMETILARIKEMLTFYLPETAVPRAIEILHQYYELKSAEIDLEKQLSDDYLATEQRPSHAEMKRLLRDLRASNMDAEAYTAFFGKENMLDDYAIRRLEIQGDESLTDNERHTALIAIEEHLPEADREHKRVERTQIQALEAVAQGRRDGASDAEIFEIRTQAFGAEAAQRFAEADQRQATWDSRVSAYRAERREILASEGIAEEDKAYEIDQLRQGHFQDSERKRIPVIDKMKDIQGKR